MTSERNKNSSMDTFDHPQDICHNVSFQNPYKQLHICAQPQAIYYHDTDVPSDGNCFFFSVIKTMNLSTTPIDIRRQLLASPYVDCCINPHQVRSILSSEEEYAEMDCIDVFSKVYNQNICIHYYYVNVISSEEEQQFLQFRVNNTQSFIHLHLQDVHFTPLIEVFDIKSTKSRAEYMKKYRKKKKAQNDLTKLNMCIDNHSNLQKNQSKSEHSDSQINSNLSSKANRKRRMRHHRIDDDARQVIYFVNEAGCVSKGLLINKVNEIHTDYKLEEESSTKETWKKNRLQQSEKLRKSICDIEDKPKTPKDAKKPKKIVTALPEPPPLVRKPEIKAIREQDKTEPELPPLTPISKPEKPPILKPFVIKSTSPPPLTPIITKTFSPQIPTKSDFSNPGSSHTITSGRSPTVEMETRDSNVWIKYESDLSDYDDKSI